MTKATYCSVCWLPILLCLVHEGYVKYCGLMIGLQSMCEFIWIHIHISLLDLDCDYEKGFIRSYMKKNKYICIMTRVYCNVLMSFPKCVFHVLYFYEGACWRI